MLVKCILLILLNIRQLPGIRRNNIVNILVKDKWSQSSVSQVKTYSAFQLLTTGMNISQHASCRQLPTDCLMKMKSFSINKRRITIQSYRKQSHKRNLNNLVVCETNADMGATGHYKQVTITSVNVR